MWLCAGQLWGHPVFLKAMQNELSLLYFSVKAFTNPSSGGGLIPGQPVAQDHGRPVRLTAPGRQYAEAYVCGLPAHSHSPANTAAGDHPRFLWKLITEYPSPTAARMILKIFFLHAQNATEARALKVSQRMGNSSE